MPGVIQKSVRGLMTLSGGTRTAVKTDRSAWQPNLQFPQSRKDCPLCSKEQTDEFAAAPGWKTFQNSSTPFPFHRLLIPKQGWDGGTLRALGGAEAIEHMFDLALTEIIRTDQSSKPMWIYPHVGYGAGQNFTHMHAHLCQAPTQPRSDFCADAEGSVHLWNSESFVTFLSGVRAGQAVIQLATCSDDILIDDPVRQLFELGLLHELAVETSRLIERFNAKFGNPDYCVMLALNGGIDWHVRYTPILNNWGGSEYAALDYGTPFVLPWPHEATRDFLLAD